jgi:4-amino-4-deoxy-L-arabinose transferase-like glycosyltransferase
VQGWLVRCAIAAALALPFFWRLDAEEFHGDESHWTSSGRQAFFLATSGRLDDPQWRDEFYFYSQPQVGKLLIGAAQALGGYRGSSPVYDYDWQLVFDQNRIAGRVPAPGALLAARVPSATAGWLGCLLLWALATQLGIPTVGPLAAVLLASHPLWLANSRRAGLDTPALCLGLASAFAMLCASRPLLKPSRAGAIDELLSFRAQRGISADARSKLAIQIARLAWWLLAGALLGLAAGTKYVGLLAVVAAAPPLLWRLVALRCWSILPGVALATVVFCLVFFRTNPALYQDPITEVRVSIGFLADQAEGMRLAFPEFRSPVWVAAEIVDRAIWPAGGPHILDRTLPEPLRPGTYGTPIVALGAVIALVALTRRDRFPRLRLPGTVFAGLWSAGVFLLLAESVPTWWERWHLPLVPPLVLLAAAGLASLGQARLAWALSGAQLVSAVAMEPSFLGRGFGALVTTPAGAIAHLGALAYTLVTLVLLARAATRLSIQPLPDQTRLTGQTEETIE